MSNSLDPAQARHFVGPDLGPNCLQRLTADNKSHPSRQRVKYNNLPIGQRPIALLDSSKSINIKSISTAATIYLMSTALQNCKINCLYSVLPGKLEVIMLIALINWYKSYVLFHCHNIDHSNNNNR